MDEFESWNDFRKIRFLRRKLSEFSPSTIEEKDAFSQLELILKRLIYRYDFFKFVIEALDAESKGEQPVKLGVLHKKLCRHIRRARNLGRNCLIRIPRYHLKTQIATTYYRIWRFLNDPELCSLIVSGTLDLSKDTSRTIKNEIVNNSKLKALYPEVLPEWIKNERKNKWSETEFNVARKGNYAQCTVEAVGVNATVTGKHFGEIGFDDVVTKENSQNAEQCEKVINSYKYFLSIANPKRMKGKIPIMVVGTPYNDHDLYSFLDENSLHLFMSFFFPIPLDCTPIWGEFYTKEMLMEIRQQQGPYVFATQYHLDPVPEDQQEFKKGWIQTFRDLPKDVNGNEIELEKIVIVDPITMKPTNSSSHDRGVVLTLGCDKRKSVYALDYILYPRATEDQLFDGIFAQCEKWGTTTVLWESIAYQAQGAINLEIKSNREGKGLKVIQFQHGHRDKDTRIRSMIPHFEQGQIYVRFWMQELITELIRFPHGKTRDIIDVLATGLKHFMTKRTRVGRGGSYGGFQKPFYH